MNVCVGQIVDFGTVSTTSLPDMPCKAYAVQSGQGVEYSLVCLLMSQLIILRGYVQ